MSDLFNYFDLNKNYSLFQNSNFLDRYVNFKSLEDYLFEEIFDVFDHEIIGYSELQLPIYSIEMGKGQKKILMWSQMHGNESTTTKSLLDLINFVRYNRSELSIDLLLNSCKIKIILMLNPDGSNKYTRTNANGIDLNRDAVDRSQSESQCFFKCLEKFKPDFCFNMHGQRTIFSAGLTNKPATLSFLAPSFDEALTINESRMNAMQLVVAAAKMLENFIPGQIAKYDDAHNPNCFGDCIQKLGIPTVLFEAGHFAGDYDRNMTRKYVMLGALKMLECITSSNLNDFNIDDYFKIPNNEKLFLDIIIQNVSNSKTGFIGIMYTEVLKDGHIEFQPYVKNLDNLSDYSAHRYIDTNQKLVKINGKSTFYPDMSIENIEIAGKNIAIKL